MLKKTLPVRPRLLEGFGEAEYVASGSSCDVYRVCCEGREYALKVMDCGNNPERYRRAMDEVLLQWQVEGRPNLVELKCYETMEHCGSRYVFLLQSYMPTLEG